MSAANFSLRRAFWRAVFRVTGGLTVTGSLPAGGCVVVANHCSHADAPALVAAIDAAHRPLVAAAADYWFHTRLRAFVCRRLVGGFPVRRTGGGYADLAAQRPALDAGRTVVVFPAGSRRSLDGRFHAGAFRLAAEAGVPVVAARLTGTAAVVAGRRATVHVAFESAALVTEPESAARTAQQLVTHE